MHIKRQYRKIASVISFAYIILGCNLRWGKSLTLMVVVAVALVAACSVQGGQEAVFAPQPDSTLLAANTTELRLEVKSRAPDQCRYTLSETDNWAQMHAFDTLPGGTQHVAVIKGVNPDPSVLNHVYVRCSSAPQQTLSLRYRCLPSVRPGFPRTGNLWGRWNFDNQPIEKMARIDLWLGANGMPVDKIRQLRKLNPNVLVLTSINAIEEKELPADYYLKDINGRRVEVWPGSFRLNLTKPYVAEHQARLAADMILKSDLMFDGCFFDNVMLSQWPMKDIYDRPFPIDGDEDGKPDNPQEFDKRWRAGVLHEIQFFRRLMPNALMSGHSLRLEEPVIRESFHGISIGFQTSDAIEGRGPFPLDFYRDWMTLARPPQITMVESAIPNQIAYGYGYSPYKTIPPSTLDFARDYFPYMRFGLCFTLLHDGYFAHEVGDTWHGNAWWYDELDFELGQPSGPAQHIGHSDSDPDLLAQDGFQTSLSPNWRLWADAEQGYVATLRRTAEASAETTGAVQVNVTAGGPDDWRIDLAHHNTILRKDTAYELRFLARSDQPRRIRLNASKGKPNWDNYGLNSAVNLNTQWAEHVVIFTSLTNANDARLQFYLGNDTGSACLAAVTLREAGPEIYRRDFEHGVVLLNASRSSQTVHVGPGFARLKGQQAPLVQYIVDDDSPGFRAEGSWKIEHIDSGEWKALGPYYHQWGKSCRTTTAPKQVAEWTLRIPASDTYHIAAWWPALPSNQWSQTVRYEIVCKDVVKATAEFNQREGGDQWHRIGNVLAGPEDHAFVRAYASDGTPFVADAIHITSEARYNNGAPAEAVELAPMDGIILRRASATLDGHRPHHQAKETESDKGTKFAR